MPTPTLTLDTVRGAQLEKTLTQTRLIRTGFVKDIDLTATNDADALMKVLSVNGMPPMGSALSPANQHMKLQRLRVFPQEDKHAMVRLELLYETRLFDATPTAYLLRDRTFTIQKTDCFIPGTRFVMEVGFESETDAQKPFAIEKQPVFMNLNLSARSLQVVSLQYGRPDGGAANYNNYVNDATWPDNSGIFNGTTNPSPFGIANGTHVATPLAKGFWRIASYATEYDRQRGMTTIQAEAVTKIIEDWSHVGMVRNERSGRYPFASLTPTEKVAVYNLMNTPGYAYGPIYPTGAQKHKGIGRWGPYPMTDFSTVFGF